MASPTLNWPRAAVNRLPDAGVVEVWAVALDPESRRIAPLAKLLSSDEQERARAYKFPRLRDRYTVARGQLRRLLGEYLHRDPVHLEFDYSPRGKPSLKGAGELHFNLAHSDELALIAVTCGVPVGVDVERIRPMPDAEGIAERFFSARELTALRGVPVELRDAAFFRLWSRKEAWLKATGDGIAESLSKIEVAFLPDEPARVLAIAGDAAAGEAWSLASLEPAAGFTGALAIPRREIQLRCHSLD